MAKILAEFVGVELKEFHFRAIHRLPAWSEDQPPPIILVLNDIDVKHNLIRGAKLKKPTGANFGVQDFPIYIDEHLTKATRELLNGAKELKKQKKIHSVSCRDGIISIREREGSRWIKIADKSQFQLLATKKRNVDARSPHESASAANSAGRDNCKKFALQAPIQSQLSTPTSSTTGKATSGAPNKFQLKQSSQGSLAPKTTVVK